MNTTVKQIGSAVITLVLYCYFLNWKVALLLMIGIGFHEYSHLFAAKQLGLKTGGFYFIPGIGGVSLVTEAFKSFKEQVIVVLAGPIGGGLLGIVTAFAFFITDYSILGMSALWMCILNLFNLLPFSFMDGGQLLNVITHSINRTLGFIVMTLSTLVAIVVISLISPLLGLLIIFFGTRSIISEYRNWNHLRHGQDYLCDEYYLYPPIKLSTKQIILTLGAWGLTSTILLWFISKLFTYPNTNFNILFQ